MPAGFVQTSATCDDGSPVGNIDVAADETVTCAFANTLQRGAITVTKLSAKGDTPLDRRGSRSPRTRRTRPRSRH